jgi:dTDP-4-amino-4,6-dideoxygalactose transaminase
MLNNKKISWVPYKNINKEYIDNKINECLKTKHFTNNGKNVIELQKNIKNMFRIDYDKEVLLVCNGAMGINALIGGLNMYFNKKLKFVVQAFTFPCSKQGILMDSLIFDIDENMGPNINELENRKDEYDGIVITNCFGCCVNINLYEKFCKDNNKILLFDNAASPYTIYNNKNILNYGDGCIVSLHHTKPIGFGEGGFIIFDKKYLDNMKKSICFGYTDTNRYDYDVNASNYKMSDISAIYISSYLENIEKINEHHKRLIKYFVEKKDKVEMFKTFGEYENSLMACIPILFDKKIDTNKFVENNIEAKKYYYPLDNNCLNSVNIFERIICLPLNIDITEKDIDFYLEQIIKIN